MVSLRVCVCMCVYQIPFPPPEGDRFTDFPAPTPCRFACVYTSHVSNLIFSSPLKSYRGKSDTMIHEDELNM